MRAGSLYAASRDMEVPSTMNDVGAVSNVKRKDLARSYRLLLKELDIKMPVAEPSRCVSRIASRAGMTERTQRRAREILFKASQLRISAGKDPIGLAGSALYVACTLEGEDIAPQEGAEA